MQRQVGVRTLQSARNGRTRAGEDQVDNMLENFISRALSVLSDAKNKIH